jgi:hypothetical protein
MSPDHVTARTVTPVATVVSEDVFDVVVRLEIKKSLRLQYPFSLLTVRAAAGDPMPTETELAARLSEIVAAVLRSTDVVMVGRGAAGTFLHLLLIDAQPEHLPGVVARIRGEVEQHRFGFDGTRVELSIGAASFPTTAATLEDLRAQAMGRATM